MTAANESNDSADQRDVSHHRLRLPGFIADDDIGLGDVIKQVTSYFGIPACGKCDQRAAALNRWMAFSRRNTR
jgi:hypothetical protein